MKDIKSNKNYIDDNRVRDFQASARGDPPLLNFKEEREPWDLRAVLKSRMYPHSSRVTPGGI